MLSNIFLSIAVALQAQAAVYKINDNDPKNEAIENIIVLMLENRSFDTFLVCSKANLREDCC